MVTSGNVGELLADLVLELLLRQHALVLRGRKLIMKRRIAHTCGGARHCAPPSTKTLATSGPFAQPGRNGAGDRLGIGKLRSGGVNSTDESSSRALSAHRQEAGGQRACTHQRSGEQAETDEDGEVAQSAPPQVTTRV